MLSEEKKSTVKFVQGNVACAQAALDAGVRFFAGYPITPSSEIMETLSQKLPQVGGKFIQMEDEIASMGAVLGAALTGMKSMTATSGPGFSLKQELIGFAAICEIPCVIVNVQRSGPSTGMPTSPSQGDVMQSRWGCHGDHPIIVLSPFSVSEMYELTITAINFSERYRTPVILLADETIGHLYEKVEFPDEKELKLSDRPRPEKKAHGKYLPFATGSSSGVPRIADFGDGFRFNVTGLVHDLDGFPTNVPEKGEALIKRIHEKIYSHLHEICLVETQDLKEASVILCSYGASARACSEAVYLARQKGIQLGLIRLKTIWPFPDFIFEKLGGKKKTVIVCEMNLGQIINEVERVSKGRFRVEGVNSCRGTLLTPEEILEKSETIK